MEDKKIDIISQLIRITRISSFLKKKKYLKKKIAINFFTMFFNARIFLFQKQKMATQHCWVNENNEAHV